MSFLSELLSIPFIHTERGENLGGHSSHLMGAGPSSYLWRTCTRIVNVWLGFTVHCIRVYGGISFRRRARGRAAAGPAAARAWGPQGGAVLWRAAVRLDTELGI